MATLSDVRTDVRSRLDESSARLWTDAELNRWINEALRDIARRCETLQAYDDINVTANTQEYTLPTDLLRVYRVEYRPTGGQVFPLEYRDFNSMDSVWYSQQTSSRGRPYWFTMWGFPPSLKIILYPTPASTDGAIRVYHYRLPAEVSTDGATLELPSGWHDLVALYCEYIALRKDADPRWAEAKQLYEEKVGDLNDMTRRWTDQADAIQVGTSMLPKWLYDPD